MSITGLTRSSPAATRLRPRRLAGPAWRRLRWGSCLGSPRRIARGSAAGRSRPELTDETGRLLGERGREFGTVTGRARRCGWFDAALCAPGGEGGRHQRPGADQAGRAGRSARSCGFARGMRSDGKQVRHLPAAPGAQAAGAAGVRHGGGLVRLYPAGRGPGRICRPRRSSMCGGSRNWWRRR